MTELMSSSERENDTQHTQDGVEYDRGQAGISPSGRNEGIDEAQRKPCEICSSDLAMAAANALCKEARDGVDKTEENDCECEGESSGNGGQGREAKGSFWRHDPKR
jgi:hypothetical protein